MSVYLNSEQTQEERIAAFDKMRALQLKVVIATNLLARGVDLPDVRLVINLDVPVTWEELVHRVGRAGRFGSAGLAFNFTTSADCSQLETWNL
jgi:superfamily II DNA/RNA helicase